jgi:hypothetical protein
VTGKLTKGIHDIGANQARQNQASSRPWRVAMRVKVREIGGGLHPSEAVVEIQTAGGVEKLVVDRKSIQNRTIFAGWRPLAEKKGQWLIELPRETMSGTWRVWVKRNEIVPEDREAMRA